MGKKDFNNFYKKIKSELSSEFGKATVKISLYGDIFDPNKSYAGAIIYAIDGKFKWVNNGGKAKGQRGRSFYVIIQCTDNWPEEARGRAGCGLVHDYLIKNTLGINHSDSNDDGKKRVCCGGFGYRDKKLKFSSVWLNASDQLGCISDGEKYLSDFERVLVKYCFEQYMKKGLHHVFEIPEYTDKQLLGLQALQEIPSKEGCWI